MNRAMIPAADAPAKYVSTSTENSAASQPDWLICLERGTGSTKIELKRTESPHGANAAK